MVSSTVSLCRNIYVSNFITSKTVSETISILFVTAVQEVAFVDFN